ncbi:MAG: chemotaxis protein CheW [Rubrivivax sp.]|jgi:twitching motility protein PilI
MANREALRELQTRLAERLQRARTTVQSARWLAVECGRHGFLFPLTAAGEIFPAQALMPLPHAQPWFLGIANVRGALHGVVDLPVFLGLETRSSWREGAQLIGLNPSLGSHSAVLVHRLAGLRHGPQLQPLPRDDTPRPAFAGDRFADAQGRVWQEIDLAALAHHPQFLAIARSR